MKNVVITSSFLIAVVWGCVQSGKQSNHTAQTPSIIASSELPSAASVERVSGESESSRARMEFPSDDVHSDKITEASCADVKLGIVGGQTVEKDTQIYRSTAQLELIWEDGAKTRCTATLVGPRQMVSAAHCFRQGMVKWTAVFGIDPRDADDKIVVENFIIHPLYVDEAHDIAVLTLAEDAPDYTVPVTVSVPSELELGLDIIMAGYGTPSQESKKRLPLTMVSVPVQELDRQNRFINTLINGEGSCFGDSGGPGFLVDSASQCIKLAGVISRASVKGNGDCGQGDTLMDVTRYQGWLAASFAQLGYPVEGLMLDGSERDSGRNQLNTPTN